MALIIELGAPTASANTYATEAQLDAYMLLRAYTIAADKEVLLVKAFDFMQTLNWIYDHKYSYTIEPEFISGQCEIAYRLSLGADAAIQQDAAVKRSKVDVIEVEFFGGTSKTTPNSFLRSMPQAHGILKPFLNPSNVLQRA